MDNEKKLRRLTPRHLKMIECLSRGEMTQKEVSKQLNKLEQIRALDNNIKIKVLITDYNSISVDTPSDLELVKKTLDILNYSS